MNHNNLINDNNVGYNSIWITWEHQRRSIVLAEEFNATLYEIIVNKSRLLRYPYLCLSTLALINKLSPNIVFVQSPSIILAFIATLYKKLGKKFVLVVDRHSNFFRISRFKVVDWLLQFLGDFTLRNCDITIVTNESLRKTVEERNGFAVVLQDKIPKLTPKMNYKLGGKLSVLYPCSFSVDEPINEVLQCAKMISKDIKVYITGNYKKSNNKNVNLKNLSENIVLLGYINEQEYIDYMSSVDCVLALTTWDKTLLCCAYEAVSLKKPLILSNKKELCDYFYKGTVRCDNNAYSIAKAFQSMIEEYNKYKEENAQLKKELLDKWYKTFTKVVTIVNKKTEIHII